jgi:hypothetical protein
LTLAMEIFFFSAFVRETPGNERPANRRREAKL